MGLRSRNQETLTRLASKTPDARFVQEICHGLNCSRFEARAVLDVVKEVYSSCFEEATAQAPPGKVSLVVVSADEPAGKPVADCEKVTVCLTVHRGEEDDRLLQEKGAQGFRQGRIPEICEEAFSQGGLLTCEDLAFRIFFVHPRTIWRDVADLRREDPHRVIALRSRVRDIGPALTHRVQIVRLAMEGKTTTQICRITHHSPQAVANYLSTFERCLQLARRGMEAGQIAFVLRRGKGLIRQYLELLLECESDRNLAYHLEELMRLGGPRIRKLCAEMILEGVHEHLEPKDHVRHGQVRWLAVAVDDPPRRHQRIADTKLVAVVLDLSTAEDVQGRLDRVKPRERLRRRAVRLCHQAFKQRRACCPTATWPSCWAAATVTSPASWRNTNGERGRSSRAGRRSTTWAPA
jgi:DNA-binding CsgD family transcriptional regulator